MQKNKTVVTIMVTVILLAFTVLFMLLTRTSKAPVLVSRTDPPRISFEDRHHDLGTVSQGEEIVYVFQIHNIGGEPLIIDHVTSNCECLVLDLKDKYIEPGKTGQLETILDTTLEKGEVRHNIDVFSNDPKQPRASIYLLATIQPKRPTSSPNPKTNQHRQNTNANMASQVSAFNPHVGLTDAQRANIFKGQCATCHVNPGRGKWGADLYQADCAMCHGQNAEGGLGPALVPGAYHEQEFLNRIQKTIRYGSDRYLSMPGFLKDAGGPLSDSEIDSIVQFLQTKSDQAKGQYIQVPGG